MIIRPSLTLFACLSAFVWAMMFLLLGSMSFWASILPSANRLGAFDVARHLLACALIGLIGAVIPMIAYIASRNRRWEVNGDGVRVYTGKRLRRALAWPDVKAIDFRTYGVSLTLTSRPCLEMIGGVDRRTIRELRRFLNERRQASQPGFA